MIKTHLHKISDTPTKFAHAFLHNNCSLNIINKELTNFIQKFS